MVARVQGWHERYKWGFTGRKAAAFCQIGNTFPSPVAEAVGSAVRDALLHVGTAKPLVEQIPAEHDPIYATLKESNRFMNRQQIERALRRPLDESTLERHISDLSRDFHIEYEIQSSRPAYRLGEFKAFTGTGGSARHEALKLEPSRNS